MLVITTATYIVGTSSTITTAPVGPVPKFSSTCFFCRMARARSLFYLLLAIPPFGPSAKRAPPNMPSTDFSAAITNVAVRSVQELGHVGDLPR